MSETAERGQNIDEVRAALQAAGAGPALRFERLIEDFREEIRVVWAGALWEIALGYSGGPDDWMTAADYAHRFLLLQHNLHDISDEWWEKYMAVRRRRIDQGRLVPKAPDP